MYDNEFETKENKIWTKDKNWTTTFTHFLKQSFTQLIPLQVDMDIKFKPFSV